LGYPSARAFAVILNTDVYEQWTDPAKSVPDAKKLLKQNLDDNFQMYRVDRQINSNRWSGDETAIRPI
jgi:putative SOS response-associated peptidase YedK